MWLKLLIFIIAGVAVYRFFGGKVPFLDRNSDKKDKDKDYDFEQIEATSACSTCGMYITEDDALIFQKKSYCSNNCLEKSKK